MYLGHTLAYYFDLYGCRHVLLLGRVMSGKGGDLIYAAVFFIHAVLQPKGGGALQLSPDPGPGFL